MATSKEGNSVRSGSFRLAGRAMSTNTNTNNRGQKWYVYLLHSKATRRTYVGATTNPTRRLRQHNGEIVGGAKSTRKGAGTWSLVCYIGEFENRSTCYRWEKLIKSRASGFRCRVLAMQLVSAGICPVNKKYPRGPVYIPPNMLTLTVLGVLPHE